MTGVAIELVTTFRYHHSFGEMAPFYEGLKVGKAMATKCHSCGLVWFAPRLVCACGGNASKWTELPGTGTVRVVTTGNIQIPLTPHSGIASQALISMDGAGNTVLGRFEKTIEPASGLRVLLTVDSKTIVHPVQAALFVPL